MEKQKLEQYLAGLVENLVSELSSEGIDGLSCCFTGHRPQKVTWLADDGDYRTDRLRVTLKSLIDNLSMRGVTRYIAGNAEGFDTIAAETVLASNKYLETSKDWEGVPQDWQPAELEIAIPFEGHEGKNQRALTVQERATVAHVVSNQKKHALAFLERNEYMVDHADLVIALLDQQDQETGKGGTTRTVVYALGQGKPVVLFRPDWFEAGWPGTGDISILLPEQLKNSMGHN